MGLGLDMKWAEILRSFGPTSVFFFYIQIQYLNIEYKKEKKIDTPLFEAKQDLNASIFAIEEGTRPFLLNSPPPPTPFLLLLLPSFITSPVILYDKQKNKINRYIF